LAGSGVGVVVGVEVGVDVEVGIGVVVGVDVGIGVGVAFGVDVGMGVSVRVTVGVSVGAGVSVGIDSASVQATTTKANDMRQTTCIMRLTIMIYLLSFSSDHPGKGSRGRRRPFAITAAQ
jgi:hypothetical protein